MFNAERGSNLDADQQEVNTLINPMLPDIEIVSFSIDSRLFEVGINSGNQCSYVLCSPGHAE